MNVHKLKTWPKYFEQVLVGIKNFEVRKNDRDFKIGDKLHLMEWCPDKKEFTGRSCQKEVNCIVHGGQFGIEEGYVVMGLYHV